MITASGYDDANMGIVPGPGQHRTRRTAAWLVTRLLAWYDDHRRALPWRAEPGAVAAPYRVLLSEVMLQQTTVATVARRFEGFVARFPDLATLAAAEEAEVLHAWQGLGYYRRARALHACARALIERHGGELPQNEDALRALPGIGPYTASAIRAIAHGEPAVPVDGNVARIVTRLARIETPLPAAAAEVHAVASRLRSRRRAGDLAQALMDLGATVCRPRRPRCSVCPWREACLAHAAGLAEALPRRAPRAARPTRRGVAFLLRRRDGAMLFRKRPSDGLLGGLHELPSSPWTEDDLPVEVALGHAPAVADWTMYPRPVRHVFTHFRLELALAEARTDRSPAGLWCGADELQRLALPTVMIKLLRMAGVTAAGEG